MRSVELAMLDISHVFGHGLLVRVDQLLASVLSFHRSSDVEGICESGKDEVEFSLSNALRH